MRWTAEGLEAILQLRLVKYADPEYYQAFLDELLQRSTKTAINCDLSIESTSGKVCTALQHDQKVTLSGGWPETSYSTTKRSLGDAVRAMGWYRQFREIVLMFAITNIEPLCEPL